MLQRAVQIIAEVLHPYLAPTIARGVAENIVNRLDEVADAPVLAVDDVVQIAHTASVCPGCLAHVSHIYPDGAVKVRMPSGNGNHGFAILPPEHLIPTGGSITPQIQHVGGCNAGC